MEEKNTRKPGPRLDGVSRPRRRDLNRPLPLGSKETQYGNNQQLSGASAKSQKRNPRRVRKSQSVRNSSTPNEFNEGLRALDSQKGEGQKRSLFKTPPRKIVKFLSLSVLAIGVIYGGFLGYKFLLTVQASIIDREGSNALGLQEDIKPGQLNGEGDGRVNILLIGIGGENHPGGNLNDVTMVVSIDPTNNEVAMLSIPRDLYLTIPGYYSTRINSAYALGEGDTDTTGEKLTRKVVEDMLDIDIHYFARIDFQGFVKVIDQLGGITVNVEESIYDPFIESGFDEGYRTAFRVQEGEQYMDGATALQYARSRKTTSDFDRARRQQIVLQAVKDKVLSLGTFSNPLKINDLLNVVKDHFQTDIGIPQGLRMLEIGKQINKSAVTSAVIDNSPGGLLVSQNISGAAVLVPRAGLNNFSEIQAFVKGDLFADGFIKKENASITVLNGTNVAGLATEAANELNALGYNVEVIDDAPQKGVSTTRIYEALGDPHPYTSQLLKKRFDTQVSAPPPSSLTYTQDIIIVLGEDYANQR